MPFVSLIFLVPLAILLSPVSPHLQINELLASNTSILADGRGEFDDWLEIYNPAGAPIDAAGMYLSNTTTRWQITASDSQPAVIAAHGFLLLWCDKDVNQGNLHASSKLD